MKRCLGSMLSLLFIALSYATDSFSVRNAHAMIYHTARATEMLFGGADEKRVCRGCWEWDGKRWMRLAFHAPRMRILNDH